MLCKEKSTNNFSAELNLKKEKSHFVLCARALMTEEILGSTNTHFKLTESSKMILLILRHSYNTVSKLALFHNINKQFYLYLSWFFFPIKLLSGGVNTLSWI